MLSTSEYEDTLSKLDTIDKSTTGKNRRNLRQIFKKKLKEHEYASAYPKFQPLTYELIFINYRTTEETLVHLIETINSSTIFTLDTESINIQFQPNKPALIQLQIILQQSSSYILFIEVCRLPRTSEPTFNLIQQLFNAIFKKEKKIYIWGEIDELKFFLQFNLFISDQIYLSTNINLQDEFKDYYNEHHLHYLPSSTNNNQTCICETCIGILPNNPWSLQDAVAYELNQWLDKRQTRSQFDMGSDPKLVHLNSNELAHRQTISNYAAYDCDAIYQLIIHMNLIDNQQPSPELINEIEISSPTYTFSSTNNLPQQQTMDVAYEQISSEDDEPSAPQLSAIPLNPSTQARQPRQQLTDEERRKIHNRRCTLKQRNRMYKHEIIRRGIDHRFSVTDIKKILRERSIIFCGVNIATSSQTHKTSVYIGIKDQRLLSKYEHKTRNLFTSDHYRELYPNQYRSNSYVHHHYRQYHQQHKYNNR
jgi:hypothetical protein